MAKEKSPVQGVPHAIDIHVGNRIRSLRLERGLSQEDLGAEVGVSYQQIQKYERGTNRVSASRLYALAVALEIGIEWFFAESAIAPATD